MNLIGITDHRPLVALAPVLGLAVYCVAHVIVARIIRGRSPYPALAMGALVGLAATIVITLAACVRDSVSLLDTLALVGLNTLASLAFAFGYFNFVNLTVASLRIRILEELAAAGGRLPRAALLDRYGTSSVADLRLERLVGGGHLVERNGRLHTGRLQFLVVARIFDGLRRLIFGPAYAAALRRPPAAAPGDRDRTP
jgi:uncharacterized membrane protein YjfL (UPF0719 family)